MVKVLLIGADAASWNVIEPLVEQEKLPIFKKLMENGVWGNLKSCVYYFTSPAWKCYSTGKNPGKLGACGWWNFDKVEGKLSLVTSSSFKSREIWDILGEYGYKSGIVNMPLTYPPKKINGILISGVFNPEKGYTYPPKLEAMLKRYDYGINPVLNMKIDTDKAILERARLSKKRFFVSKKLLEKSNFDFFQLVIFCTDEVQHFFWKHMEQGDSKYKNVIENFWKLVDLETGKLLEKIGDDFYTFIISDHGATASKGVFRLNVWLKLKGYLNLKKKRTPSYRFLAATIAKPFLPTTRKILPQRIMRKFDQKMFGRWDNVVNTLFSEIDWQKTKAICIADNCIHLKARSNLKALRDELIRKIKNIRKPKSDEKVVDDVKTREEVFSGEYLSLLPDLIIIPKEGYRFCGFPRDGGTEDLWDFSNPYVSGWHKLDGVFIAYGPEIERGKKINNATIYDIVPTILHIFGVPIPRDVDGRVLKEIFREHSHLKKKPMTFEKIKKKEVREEKRYYSREEEKRVVERLRELGYL